MTRDADSDSVDHSPLNGRYRNRVCAALLPAMFLLGFLPSIPAAEPFPLPMSAVVSCTPGDTDCLIRYGILGTSGNDVIPVNVPLLTEAAAGPSGSDNVQAMATGVYGNGGHDNVHVSAGVTTSASATLDDQYLVGAGGSMAIGRGIVTGAGQDTIVNLSAIQSTAAAASDVNQLFTPLQGFVATGMPVYSAAEAVGIDAGGGLDNVVNRGSILAAALDNTQAAKERFEIVALPVTAGLYDATTSATATATGISGGSYGSGTPGATRSLANFDNVTARAEANASLWDWKVEAVGGARLDGTTKALALATGLDGGERPSVLSNSGRLDVDAVSDATLVSIELKWKGMGIKGIAGFFMDNTGIFTTRSDSTAFGLRGGAGGDLISNNGGAGLFDVYSKATALSTTVTVSLGFMPSSNPAPTPAAGPAAAGPASPLGEPPDKIGGEVQDARVDTGTLARSVAYGISAEGGADVASNASLLKSAAESFATSVAVDLDLSYSSGTGKLNWFPLPSMVISKSKTEADAFAKGIDMGAGDDNVVNAAPVVTGSWADADSTSVGVVFKGQPNGIAAALNMSDTTTVAVAGATGISGGAGGDTIGNLSEISTTATAKSDSIAVKLNASAETGGPIVAGVVVSKSDTSALSSAAGIDAGAGVGDSAADVIANSLPSGRYAIDSLADSDAVSTAVSVEFVGSLGKDNTAFVVAGTYSQAKTTAGAYGYGILSGDGGSRVENRGDIQAEGTADATSTRVDVKASGAGKGLVVGAILSDTTTESSAEGIGIAGGKGTDVIENFSGIEAFSTANGTTTGVTVDASGTLNGAVIEAVLSKSSTDSNTTSTGISGGAGTDNIVNAGTIHAKATSTDVVTDVGVSAHGAVEGVTIGVMLSKSDIHSTADAFGIEGGSGDDIVVNRSSILSEATADGALRSWKFDLGVSRNAALEVVVANTNNRADATAVGISGGAGNDVIANDNLVTANATSTPSTLGIAVALAGAPLSIAANLAWAETIGNATSFGIDGGDGDDRIANRSVITGLADAKTTTDAVSANLAMLNAAYVDAASTATARFTGIRGGAGSDNVVNEGRIAFEARGNAGSLAVAGALGLFGFVQGDVTSTAKAFATGMDGDHSDDETNDAGPADDYIVNRGSLTPLATAAANGRSISGQLLGISFSDGTTTAEATAAGIAGGAGADVLGNEGYVGAKAVSTGTGWAVSGSLLGWNRTDLDTYANAYATGLSGGVGNDTIENYGTDNVLAQATASGHTISGSVAGITDGRSGTWAGGRAAGFDGGDGNDLIRNGGSVVSVAETTANGLNVSAAVVGWQMVNPTLGSNASALGIDGGAGDDVIFSGMLQGHPDQVVSIEATAHAKTDGRDVAANIAGYADVGRNPDEGKLIAEAVGIKGGAGTDWIWNEGAVKATADADAVQASLAVAAIGYAHSRSAAGPSVSAIGIDGGDGNDNVVNMGTLLAGYLPSGRTALATVGTRPNGKLDVTEAGTGIGYAFSDAALGAFASAAGIAGGEGNDILENHGVIGVGFLDNAAGAGTKTAMAKVSATNYAIAILGKADVASVVGATADSVGMDGGEGADVVANGATGSVTVRASADAYSKDTSGSGIVASSDSQVSAMARADGLRGGKGDDTIVNDAVGSNAGSITVEAKAVVEGDGSSGSGFFADGEVVTEARATAVGIRGDVDPAASGDAVPAQGTDNVVNRGTVRAIATAESYSQPDAYAVLLVAAATGEARSYATAAAIDVGEGTNYVVNSGALRAEATAGARLTASVDTDISTTEANLYAYGVARADGIKAGDGANQVIQTATGSIEAVALVRTADAAGNRADGYADEDSTAAAAGWDSAARTWTVPISAVANGVSLGSGADNVSIAGAVSASATASATITARSNSTPYVASGKASAYVRAAATGIDAGTGANVVRNDGRIDADADAYANPQARSYSYFKTASSNATAFVTAESAGILGEGWLFNASAGIVDVTSRASSYADADTKTESTYAKGVLTASATGMGTKSDAPGVQWIRNDGTLSVAAYASESLSGTPLDQAYGHSDLNVRANTVDTVAETTAQAAGIRAGLGEKDILNAGHIEAVAHGRAHIWAIADNYWESATGNATATVDTSAQGIVALGGTNRVSNFGWISARATAADIYGRGDTDSTHANCYSTATIRGKVHATGILLGDGSDTVWNRGFISALADTNSRAEAWADTGWFDDEYETSTASATASAEGFHLGAGSKNIQNDGTLTVRAAASSSAATYGGYGGWSADAAATAFGIRADNGVNTIRNSGTIDVLAAAGSNGTRSAQAVGIRTGAGNDLIVNEGVIIAGTYADPAVLRSLVSAGKAGDPAAAGFTAGTGIDAGGGDDRVSLFGSSRIVGSVLLGDGNDTLEFSGSPTVTGTIDAGTGTNTLLLSGAGSFDREPGSIQRVVKDGPGTFTLPALAARKTLTMLGGTLEVGSIGSMDNTTVLEALVRPDGTHGSLRVTSGSAALDGRLTVLRTGGVYLPSRSVILEAPSLDGTFGQVELPASGGLVRFNYAQVDNQAVVTVEADRFVTVARNGAETAVANHLDSIASTVSGDLADRLAAMQLLAPSDFAGAFSSLSPESYEAGTKVATELGTFGLRNLQLRLANLRLSNSTDRFLASRPGEVRLASATPVSGTGIVPSPRGGRGYDAWLSGYSQSGKWGADSGFTGFSYGSQATALDIDKAFGERLWLGAGIEWANADVTMDGGRGDADIDSTAWFLYGTYAGRRGYLEGAISLGRESFRNSRLVTGGATDFLAVSFHDARTLSGLLGGGYRISVQEWSVVPNADLMYVRLREDGFREAGADNSVLIVSGRTTESLISDLGLLVSRPYRLSRGSLVPEIGLAWRHDFGIGNRQIVAAFAGAPGSPFAVEVPDASRDWVSAGGGLAFSSDDGLTAALKYLGEFRSEAHINAVFGELRISF